MLPVVVVVLAAFSETAYLTIPPKGLTFKWFANVLQDASWLRAGWTSLWLALSAAFSSMVLGTMAAYAIQRNLVAGARLLSHLFMAPVSLPPAVPRVARLQHDVADGLRG